MLKYLIILGIVLIVHPRTFGQFDLSIDSVKILKLKNQLPHLKGTQMVDCLNEISTHYSYFTFNFRRKYRDSVVAYSEKARTEAKKIGYKPGYVISLLMLSTIEANSLFDKKADHYTEAVKLIQEALGIASSLKNNNLLGAVYCAWGELLAGKNDPGKFETLKKALDYYLVACDPDGISLMAGLLCDEYMGMEKYGEALEYCEKCISSGSTGAQKYVAFGSHRKYDALLNLGYINEAAGDYVTALKYYEQADKYGSVVYGDSGMLFDVGAMHNKLGQYDSAYYYFSLYAKKYPTNPFIKMRIGETYLLKNMNDEALKIFLELKGSIGHLGVMMVNLTKAYIAKSDFGNAIRYLKPWLNYVNSHRNPEDLLEVYDLQARIYNGLGRYDSAYAYRQLYGKLKDSLTGKQFLWQLNNKLFTQRKVAGDEKKAIEIALLQKDILIKDQMFREQFLLKGQREAQIELLDKDNKIKSQLLIQEAFLKDQKEARIAILDKDNKLLDKNDQIKTQQLKQQAFVKKVLISGLLVIILIGFFIFRNLSLRRKNERLSRERSENELTMQKLESEKEHVQLQQQATELEMQALRAQMNPHFIFNCLSSINKYIVKNETVSASDYLTRFSRLIRMVLVNSQKSLIKLEDELDMLKLYLDMERLRFNNRFDYTITFVNAIEPENVFIPPMLMQPFCENAIWHGFMHKEGNGKLDIAISIYQDSLFCSIKDNGVGREKAEELKNKSTERQKSLGLKITNNRLALLSSQNGDKNFYEMSDIIDKEGRFSGTQVDFRIRYKNFVENVNA